jgi:tubulin-folding cofactor B
MGLGYFVGIQLDLPKGSSNGSVGGFSYFSCQYKYGLFVRPNEIEMGDFPPLDSDDEI